MTVFLGYLLLVFVFSLCEKNNKDNREDDIEVRHIVGQLNNDLYAIPVKRRSQKSPDEVDSPSPEKERSDESDLPPGWEKHEGKQFLISLNC